MRISITPNSYFSRSMLVVFLLLLFYPPFSTAQDLQRYEYSSRHMGTTFRIVLYTNLEALADSASKAAFNRVEKLNSLLSDYEPNSELNRLSTTSGKDTTVAVSDHLFKVLQQAQEVSQKTDGAFDVTVGPYVQLWRKMNRQPNPQLPPLQTLSYMAKRVGYQYVELNEKSQTVRLKQNNMQLDLGGIAKGYAVDEALKVLNEHGINAVLVDGGGDIVLGDAPPGRPGWNVEVLTHNRSGISDRIMLQLSNKAVATSGDLYQHVEINGKRYSHIIDPRTGLGLTDRRQVTVIAPNGTTADSYASATSVLEPQKALELINKMEGLSVFIEQYQETGIKRWQSKNFESLMKGD